MGNLVHLEICWEIASTIPAELLPWQSFQSKGSATKVNWRCRTEGHHPSHWVGASQIAERCSADAQTSPWDSVQLQASHNRPQVCARRPYATTIVLQEENGRDQGHFWVFLASRRFAGWHLQTFPDHVLCGRGRQTKTSGLWWANLEEDCFPIPNLVISSTLSIRTSTTADGCWYLKEHWWTLHLSVTMFTPLMDSTWSILS